MSTVASYRETLDVSKVARYLRKTSKVATSVASATAEIAYYLRKTLEVAINVALATAKVASVALATFFSRIKERLAIFPSRLLYSIERIFF